MHLVLFLTFIARSFWGPDPELFEDGDPRDLVIPLSDSERDALLTDFARWPLGYPKAILDYGDFQYFSASECRELHEWISARLTNTTSPLLHKPYCALRSMCQWAIDLDTGVEVQL